MKKELLDAHNDIQIDKLLKKSNNFKFLETKEDIFYFICSENHIVSRKRNKTELPLFCWSCEDVRANNLFNNFQTKYKDLFEIANRKTRFEIEIKCLKCGIIKNYHLHQFDKNKTKTLKCKNCIAIKRNNNELEREDLKKLIKEQQELYDLQLNGLIYKLDFPDGKAYIGQTVNLKDRISRHIRESNNPKKVVYYTDLGKHIRLFNNKFTINIIKNNVPWDQLNDLETKYIREFDTYNNRA